MRLRERFFGARKKDPSILVFGLGTSGGGVGVARFASKLGLSVTATDKKNKKELARSLSRLRGLPVRLVLGRHRKQDIDRADIIVKNPGVPESSPWIRYARKKKKIVTNDAELFLALVPHDRIIGVTGTKGKTTTTRLMAHVLGRSARAVGIPGTSFFDCFSGTSLPRWIVAEFSSFDLEYVTESPSIVLFTSLFADHLNRYKNFRDYADTKMRILRFQKKWERAYVVESKNIRKYIPRTYKGNLRFARPKIGADARGIPYASCVLVTAVARSLGISQKQIQQRIASFRLQPGCLEIVTRRGAHVGINSTTATNPGSAQYVIKALAHRYRHLIVITGGEDKKFPESEIAVYARALHRYASGIVVLPGSFTDRLRPYLGSRVVKARSMRDAVTYAVSLRGSVALVPAAASFNMFKNEFDRGAQFTKLIRAHL